MDKSLRWLVVGAGLCLLGWALWTFREPAAGTGNGRGADADVAAGTPAVGVPATAPNADSRLGMDQDSRVATPAGTALPNALATYAASSGAPPETGPKPLTTKNEVRLEALAKQMADSDGRARDFYKLATSEAPDGAWSDAMEQQLQQAIARHGGKFTGLQTRLPHCTRTVCMLVATGGMGTEAADADWQRLMTLVMNEPWFGANFFDTQTAVKPDAKGTMYVTYFIRKI